MKRVCINDVFKKMSDLFGEERIDYLHHYVAISHKTRVDEFFYFIFPKQFYVITILEYLFEISFLTQEKSIRDFWQDMYKIWTRKKGHEKFIRSVDDWEYLLGLAEPERNHYHIDDELLMDIFKANPRFNMREAELICLITQEIKKII